MAAVPTLLPLLPRSGAENVPIVTAARRLPGPTCRMARLAMNIGGTAAIV